MRQSEEEPLLESNPNPSSIKDTSTLHLTVRLYDTLPDFTVDACCLAPSGNQEYRLDPASTALHESAIASLQNGTALGTGGRPVPHSLISQSMTLDAVQNLHNTSDTEETRTARRACTNTTTRGTFQFKNLTPEEKETAVILCHAGNLLTKPIFNGAGAQTCGTKWLSHTLDVERYRSCDLSPVSMRITGVPTLRKWKGSQGGMKGDLAKVIGKFRIPGTG